MSRLRISRELRRGSLRWWLVYGPVRSGTTLMADLARPYTRHLVSDWGLHAALSPPLSNTPPSYEVDRPRRALLTEVLNSCRTGNNGPLSVVYKQANLRQPELDALTAVFGPPERKILCLRDPAGFMRSAVKKFPDVSLENLREINYIGTLNEWNKIGGEVFLYHPDVTGEDYRSFLTPLPLTATDVAAVRYTGSSAPELTTELMWTRFREVAAAAVNALPASHQSDPRQ